MLVKDFFGSFEMFYDRREIILVYEDSSLYFKNWKMIPTFYLYRCNIDDIKISKKTIRLSIKFCEEYIQPYIHVIADEDYDDLWWYSYSIEIISNGKVVIELSEVELDVASSIDEEAYDDILSWFILPRYITPDQAAFIDGYVAAGYIDLTSNDNSEMFTSDVAANIFYAKLDNSIGDLIKIEKPIIIVRD